MAPPKAPPRLCIKCHILTKMYGLGMCRTCWDHEYRQRPEVKGINVIINCPRSRNTSECVIERSVRVLQSSNVLIADERRKSTNVVCAETVMTISDMVAKRIATASGGSR
jgi:hypothetical protein